MTIHPTSPHFNPKGSAQIIFFLSYLLIVSSSFAQNTNIQEKWSETETTPNKRDWIPYTAIDFYKYANRGHLQQVGPMLSPGAPGWGRHSKSTHLSGTFRDPERFKNKMVSWIEGRGGTIYFPVSEGDEQLDELLIWLHPIAAHQVVSIFVDEVLVKNLSLKTKGSYYRLKLPQPLKQGEHSLRLYFRFTRPATWGGRTPGAIGPLSFVPKGQKEQILDQWTGKIIYKQQKWGALFAPPPSTWRFYFIPPDVARFKTTLYVPPYGPSIQFQVFIASDEQGEKLVLNETLHAKNGKLANSKSVMIDLKEHLGKPIRLTLKAKKIGNHPLSERRPKLTEKALLEVGWLLPRIESLYPPPKELPPSKRLLIWAIDGLKLDILFQNPELATHLPNLSWLIKNGIQFSRLWSSQNDQRNGHLMLLNPVPKSASLLKIIQDVGGRSAYVGSTLADLPATDIRFDSVEYVDPQELEEHPFRTLLMQVQQMSKLRGIFEQNKNFTRQGKPELIYIHSSYESMRRAYPFKLTQDEVTWLENFNLSSIEKRIWREYLSQLKEIDYSLAQLISELSIAGLEDDTTILITGTKGTTRKLSTPTPKNFIQHIETSAILLHPNLIGQKTAPIDKAHLSSLSDTLVTMMISNDAIPPPSKEQRGSLAPYILSQSNLPAILEHAYSGAHVLLRMKDYYLLERPLGQPTLWQWKLTETVNPNASINNLADSAPILLRTLRDGLSVSPLIEGLK